MEYTQDHGDIPKLVEEVPGYDRTPLHIDLFSNIWKFFSSVDQSVQIDEVIRDEYESFEGDYLAGTPENRKAAAGRVSKRKFQWCKLIFAVDLFSINMLTIKQGVVPGIK